MSPAFRENRMKLEEQLANFRGQWVAFSEDGKRIVGNGRSLIELEANLKARNENPSRVVVEQIPADPDEIFLGAGELG